MRFNPNRLILAYRIMAPIFLIIGPCSSPDPVYGTEDHAFGRILRLRPDQDTYFLGTYLEYLEDPEGIYTIADVSANGMSPWFVRGRYKILNFGIDSNDSFT